MPDITFLGEFFKAVKSAKESLSTITQQKYNKQMLQKGPLWIF